jgi:hypothetical protein
VSSVSICVSMSHPLLIQMQKWRSRTKFSRGKPLPFYKCELKIHRFLPTSPAQGCARSGLWVSYADLREP